MTNDGGSRVTVKIDKIMPFCWSWEVWVPGGFFGRLSSSGLTRTQWGARRASARAMGDA